MRFIDAEQVKALLDYPGLLDALEAAHRGPVPLTDRSGLEHELGPGEPVQLFLNLPAWLPGEAFGIKMVTVMPGNEAAHGLPTVQAVYQLFDGRTGAPTLTLDGTMLTLRKTAADSGLGTRLLARQDARRLVVAGAGALGPHVVAAHLAARPSIEQVLVWNRTPEKAEKVAAAFAARGIDCRATQDLEAAVRDADIVSCATSSMTPLVRGVWLRPGTHLDLIGSYTREMREADDEAVARSRLFVDSRWFTVGVSGDIDQPIAAGVITEDDIQADLFELCRGDRQGRRSDDEITLFKNGGGGHLDLFSARYLATRLG